jgi:hypothetical protein
MNRCLQCGVELGTADTDGLCAVCRHKPSPPLPCSAPPVGWQCARCGTIHAPWVDRCNCPPPFRVTYGSGTEAEVQNAPAVAQKSPPAGGSAEKEN